MNFEKKELNKTQVELTVHVAKSDAQQWLVKAAAHLSQHRPLKGFRPGKAPYDLVVREFGEAAILNEALEEIINGTFGQILEQENLKTYGKIEFDLLPNKEDEAAAYKATVTLMPEAKLGNWQDKKIKRQEVKISDEELNQALDELTTMITTEEPKNEPAAVGDKVIIDFETVVDGSAIEGGSGKGFALILGEGRMIPGFEEKIVGAKLNDVVDFTIPFPDNYHAKHLSGKPAQFKITVHQILKRVKPPIDDELAKKVGMKDLSDLKAKLSENIKKEKQEKEEENLEIAAIKQMVETSEYTEIPASMIADSIEDLVHDFGHSLAHQGMNLDQYLQSVGKTLDQVKKEFEPKAIERIKSSLALAKLASLEKFEISGDEIEEELEAHRRSHAGSPSALADIEKPEYTRYVTNSLLNRKIIAFVKNKLVE